MPDLVAGAVREYLAASTPPIDEVLADVYRRSADDGVPTVDQGAAWFLHLLATALSARRVFEIGTGYGSSGIRLARAMTAGGLLFTVEPDQARAAVAREHLARTGLADRAIVMVGDASRLLHKVAGPFDLIVQNGDLSACERIHDRLVALLRPGGALVTGRIPVTGEDGPVIRQVPGRDLDTIRVIEVYRRRLFADPRLATRVLPIGDGVAVSVRREQDGPHE